MTKFDNPLRDLKIASPCSADWNEMRGDERQRFCGDCKLNVYNLSGMTKTEAENLLSNAEGRLCVRFYKRADGSVITADCPVGWAKVKRRAGVLAAAAFSLIVSLFSSLFFATVFTKQKEIGRRLPILFATPTPEPLTGMIAVPSPTPKQRPTPKAMPRSDESETVGKIVLKEIMPKGRPKSVESIG